MAAPELRLHSRLHCRRKVPWAQSRSQLTMASQSSDAWDLLALASVHHGDNRAWWTAESAAVTYADLSHRARALASCMVSHGAGPGAHIAVCSRNDTSVLEIHFAAAYIHAGERAVRSFLFACQCAAPDELEFKNVALTLTPVQWLSTSTCP